MLKNGKYANRNEHENRETEVFWHKNRKTDLKNSQNRKTENPNVPLLHLRIFVFWENNYLGQFSVTQFRAQRFLMISAETSISIMKFNT